MAEVTLSAEEWEAAMGVVVASKVDEEPVSAPSRKPIVVKRRIGATKVRVVSTKDALTLEIPMGGGWASRTGKPEAKNTYTGKEMPNAHPVAGGPVTTADPQQDDTDDDSAIQDEIPVGGGFASRVGRPTSKETVSKEIPNNHPPATNKPRTPIDWEAAAKAAEAALNYGTDTSKGWSTGKALPAPGHTVWGQPVPGKTVPEGQMYADGRPDGKTTTSTENKAPRSSLAKLTDDNEDLKGDGASLPDGSFEIHTEDDLKNAIAKVQNALQTSPHPDGAFHEIKRHIARKADDLGLNHLMPADWQLSMARLEEAELAALLVEIDSKHSAESRKQSAARGHALPDGSYPIEDVEDLHNAILLAKSGHGNVTAAKALIRRRAKELGVPGAAKGL